MSVVKRYAAVFTMLMCAAILSGCITRAPTVATAFDIPGELEFGGPGRGAIIYKSSSKAFLCPASSIRITRDGGPRVANDGISQEIRAFWVSNIIVNEQDVFGLTMPAGNYVVSSVSCRQYKTRYVLNGTIARLSVNEGEVNKIGVMEFDFTGTSIFASTKTLTFAVRPFNQAEEEYIARRLPAVNSKAVARLMTVVEPTVRQMR